MRYSVALSSLFLLSLPGTVAPAVAEPDLELNPSTGNVESVDVDESSGGRVRHTDDEGHGGARTVTLLSTDEAEDPRIAIDKASGDSWVVWWKDTSVAEVRYSRRDVETGQWSAEAVISEAGEDSRDPEIVHQAGTAWIAYEVHGNDVAIAVVGIIDDIEPIVRTTLDSTPYTGNVDVLAHGEASHVWVTWIDSATHVG
jgi:hypothetical protein